MIKIIDEKRQNETSATCCSKSAVERLVKRLRFWLQKSKMMFYTHTLGDWCALGTLHDGKVVTKIKQTKPTALIGGGRAPCWEIWGKDA